MKYLISLLIACMAITYVNAQLYNGGCDITIQEGAKLYVADSYIHEAGSINNDGILSIRDGFSNISGTSPFSGASGRVIFFGNSPNISGAEINFNDLDITSQDLTVSDQALSIDGRLSLGNSLLNLGANPLLLHAAGPTAVSAINGGILANNPTTVVLGVGSGMDSYVLPFHNGMEQITTMISLASMASDGANIAISTFATTADNTPLPMTVNNLDILGQSDGLNVVDRFWHVVPNGFAQIPQGSLSLTYSTMDNQDNNIDADALAIQQWQGMGPWSGINSSISANTVSTVENLSLDGFFVLASAPSDAIEGMPIVMYNLDECDAYLESRTFQDYSEFVPQVNQLACASVMASNVERQSPEVNTHSCTSGLNGTEAMCVSSLASCDFVADDPLAVRFSTTLNPTSGESINISGLSFFEQAPEMFDWIDGADGLNNYPTMFGLRVLRDGVEIYRDIDNATSRDWTERSFTFSGEDFEVTDITVFTFEFLGYCHVGNDSEVTAWDFEDIAVYATCGIADESATVTGMISSNFGEALENVAVSVMNQTMTLSATSSNEAGLFKLNQDDSIDEDAEIAFRYQTTEMNTKINVVDLIRLYYHLIGSWIITDTAELLAADVNGDNRINALDFVELQNRILGRSSLIENGQRVYIYSSDLEITDLSADDSPITYAGLSSSEDIVDITSILRGDLFNSNLVARTRNAEGISLSTSTDRLLAAQDNQVALNLYDNELSDLSSVKLDLDLKPGIILSDVYSDSYEVAYYINDQHVTILGVRLNTAAIDGDHPMFTLAIDVDRDIDFTEAVGISQNAKIGEGTTSDDFVVQPIRLTIEKDLAPQTDVASVMEIYPNPTDLTSPLTIYVTDVVTADATIEVYDVLGKQLAVINNPVKGPNSINLDQGMLANSAFVMVRFFNGQNSQSELISIIK